MARAGIRERLRGGDRRSIGAADELAAELLSDPGHFDAVMDAMLDPDPLVAMRAADVAEKVTARRPELLERHRARLFGELAQLDQKEVRWHVALMLPRLALAERQRREAEAILVRYLCDSSRIVQVNALQGLFDLAGDDAAARERLASVLEGVARRGSPAVRARARRLHARLEQPD